MMSAKNLTILAALTAMSFAGAANADTSGPFTSATVGPYNTDFGTGVLTSAHPFTNLTLPTFDTTLGTLTGISFSVGGSVTTSFSGTDLSGNANTITLTSQATLSLFAPPSPTPANLIASSTPSASQAPFTIGPGANFGPIVVVAPVSSTVSNYTGSFLPFETLGSGTVSMPVSANGQSTASDSNGNIATVIRTNAQAFGSVTYFYTPVTTGVPEPGSVAMLVAGGMTGAGFFIRRRRK